jgi:aquaporin Z
MLRQHVVEALGTFFLMMALMVNPLALGFMLMAWIYIGGHISGGYYNPAFNMLAQLGGALVMVLYSYWVSGQMVKLAEIPVTESFVKMMVPEILLTFIFISLFLAANSVSALRESGLNGLALGLTLMALGTILGGGLNPALAGAVMLGNAFVGAMPTMHAVLVQVVSPFIGGALAVLFFKFINAERVF